MDMAPGVIPVTLPPSGTAGGDLSGSYPNPGVTKIQGNPVVATAPTNQQILKWNGSQWAPAPDDGVTTAGAGLSITGNTVTNTGDLNGTDDINIGTSASGDLTGTYPNPTVAANAIGSSEITDATIGAIDMAPGVIPTTLPPSGSAGGDLSGSYPNPGVTKIQGNPVVTTAPTNQQILKWNGSQWAPAPDDGVTTAGAGLSITGNTVTNTGDLNGTDDINIGTSAGGDLTGTYPNPTVAANAIGSSEITDATIGAIDLAPGVIPTTLPPNGAAGGDLSGSYPNPGVTKIQGNPVVATAPTNQQILKWNGSLWAPAADDGVTTAGAGLSITGNTVTNTGDLNGTDDINIGTAAGGDLTGSYPNPSVAANAIGSAEISDGSILHSDLATDIIDSTNIVNGSVIHADLADNAVDSAKIENGTVTALDLTSGPVTDGKLLTADGLGNVNWENPAVQTLIADADGDTKIQVEESADEDVIRFDLAGVE
ncbi:MAG: hypothetical protein IPJ54_12285 [Saprospiraceae bacterium]|nr:hypothetical protein [Saprospiraceae bacterium]